MADIDLTSNCCTNCSLGGANPATCCLATPNDTCIAVGASSGVASFPSTGFRPPPAVSGPGLLYNFRGGGVFVSMKFHDSTTGLDVCFDTSIGVTVACSPDSDLITLGVIVPKPSAWWPPLILEGTGCATISLKGSVTFTGVSAGDGSFGFDYNGDQYVLDYGGLVAGGLCGTAGTGMTVPLVMPAFATSAGTVPSQTINITLTPTFNCPSPPAGYLKAFGDLRSSGYPSSSTACCPDSGVGPFNDTDTMDPAGSGNVVSACCSIPGVLTNKFLNFAILNVSCDPCADGVTGALVYLPALKAWTGNFIVCGAYMVVYVYCVPPTSFGIALYWGGVLGTPAAVTGNLCNPLDLQWDVSFPVVGTPGCPVGGHLTIRVFEP